MITEKCCMTCKFYEPISHRGQRYPKGKCQKHFAFRLSDKYQTHLSVTSPREYVCDLHEDNPQPIYAVVDGESFLVPPTVANDLVTEGWVYVKLDQSDDGKLILRKDTP
jgi:hypothetical protein